MKSFIRYFTIIVICTLYAFPQLACSEDGYTQIDIGDGYYQITIENELGSYSVEYPSRYKKELRKGLEYNPPFIHLMLDGPIKKEQTEVFDPGTGEIKTVVGERGTSSISIYTTNFKAYYGESYSMVDRIESLLEDEAKWEHFKLQERSPLTISGSQGELVVYLVDKLMPIPREDGKNMEYVRAVFFDYNNLTWEIEAICNEDIQDQVKADFDHIIETFVILR